MLNRHIRRSDAAPADQLAGRNWIKWEVQNATPVHIIVYDEEDACYYCEVHMDEDDMIRVMEGHYRNCPYYRNGDEYAVVRRQ